VVLVHGVVHALSRNMSGGWSGDRRARRLFDRRRRSHHGRQVRPGDDRRGRRRDALAVESLDRTQRPRHAQRHLPGGEHGRRPLFEEVRRRADAALDLLHQCGPCHPRLVRGAPPRHARIARLRARRAGERHQAVRARRPARHAQHRDRHHGGRGTGDAANAAARARTPGPPAPTATPVHAAQPAHATASITASDVAKTQAAPLTLTPRPAVEPSYCQAFIPQYAKPPVPPPSYPPFPRPWSVTSDLR
jgi:hypothetical protein